MKLTKHIIISISSILLCSCAYTRLGKTTINYEDSSYYIDGNRTINNNITTLNINWVAGNIYVISNETQTSTIEIKEEITKGKDITNKLVVRSFIDLNTLNIQFGYPREYEINDFRKDLHISLSNDYNLDNLNISTIQGNIETSFKNIKNINAASTSSNFIGKDLDVDRLTFNSVSGDLNINGKMKEIIMNSTSGNSNVTNYSSTSNNVFNTVSGDTIYNISSSYGYKASFSTISGTFTSNVEYLKSDGNYIYKEENHEIKADSISGNLTINTIE